MRSSIARPWVFYIGLALVSAVLIGKLFSIQVLNGESYREEAERQYVAPSTGIFNRGTIFFTEKNGERISAATLKNGFTIAINPTSLENPNKTYNVLSSIIEIDEGEFLEKAYKTDDPYEEIARRVIVDKAETISGLALDGVIVVKDRWRFYPGNTSAAQTLGFVGYKGDILSGRYGLERFYNEVLEREDPRLYINFFAEVFSNISSTLLSATNKREGDIVTSIEPSAQRFLEIQLEGIVNDWNAESAGGVIIDPTDGSIYAIAEAPTFNPNSFNTEDPNVFSNNIVESVYEMGSIIKPLTMAAGIDAGVITAKTTYEDKGYLILNGSRISNFDGKARGVVPMQEILSQSLNTGVAFIAEKLGKEVFREYMLSYGIGKESGIDLPNEVVGLVSNLDSNRKIEHATASFGQGIAMTPIATVRALSSLANGGILITPHLLKEIDYTVGISQKYTPNDEPRILKSDTSEEVSRMLVEVVDEALLGGIVALPRHSIAAKTGTAQIANNEEGGYYDDRFLHSFFGYFPAYDPKFLVFLYTVNPKEVRYASQTLTHPFMDITKFLINYYEIPPDR